MWTEPPTCPMWTEPPTYPMWTEPGRAKGRRSRRCCPCVSSTSSPRPSSSICARRPDPKRRKSSSISVSAFFSIPRSTPTGHVKGPCQSGVPKDTSHRDLSDATLRFDLVLSARRRHAPKSRSFALDMCASPGSETMQVVEHLGERILASTPRVDPPTFWSSTPDRTKHGRRASRSDVGRPRPLPDVARGPEFPCPT